MYCVKSDNLITFETPATVQYNVATTSQFELVNLIQTPLHSDIYLFDIEIYDASWKLIRKGGVG